MFTVERRVGRVVEIRVESLMTAADADAFVSAVRARVLEAAPAHAVICADHRPVRIYPQVVTDRLTFLFTSLNPHIERAGLVIARSNATFSFQMERMVRESLNPKRRVFYETDELVAWLGEVLSEAEIGHVRAFLSRGPDRPVRRGSERPGPL